jgi:UDP-N-acetyl-D-galactosamine dehydrogenase
LDNDTRRSREDFNLNPITQNLSTRYPFINLKQKTNIILSVTGLGYVGLPLALEFAKQYKVIGFDINKERIALMQQGIDPSNELTAASFNNTNITFTSNFEEVKDANFHIIGVPTDIDKNKVPNLNPLLSASKSIGKILKKGDTVVYESTVYPGCTEEDCVPVLEKHSGLKAGVDFHFGYSPERIVPGDKVKTVTKILKIVSGNSPEALEKIAAVYGSIIEAGLHHAPSIKVAEAAKVIENTQRDINISLMNELAIIFDKMNIDTQAVIEAAGTKWNFHKYQPGLVGGHCISVDPFYLMHKAKKIGIDPQVIAAGRRVNDFIPTFIAKKVVQTLIEQDKNPGKSRVLVMGITFKEEVSDIRNSKVIDLIKELKDYSVEVDVIDPYASAIELNQHYNVHLTPNPTGKYDSIIVAVGHQVYRNMTPSDFEKLSNGPSYVYDIKGVLNKNDFKNYWRL